MKRAPSSVNRIIDASALLLVVGGLALFAFARSALTGIGNDTRTMPEGVSAVAVADFYVAQSTMAVWVIGVGMVVGIVAAVRHFRSKQV